MKNIKNFYPKQFVIGAAVGTLIGFLYLGIYYSNSDLKTDVTGGTATSTATTDSSNTELDNARQNLESSRKNYENRANEQKNNFRNTKADLTSLSNKMGEWKMCLDKTEIYITSDATAANDQRAICDDLSRDVDDEFRTAYAKDGLANSVDNIKNNERQLKDIERNLKDIKKSAGKAKTTVDTSKLDAYYTEMQAIITRQKELSAQASTTTDPETLSEDIQDLNNDFNGLTQDFYADQGEINDAVNNASNLENASKNLKDKERELKNKERELKRLSKENGPDAVKEFENGIAEMRNTLTQIQTAITNGDSELLNDLDRDYWDLNSEVNDIQMTLNELGNTKRQQEDAARTLKDKSRQIKEMERECKRVKCEGSQSGEILSQINQLLEQMKKMAETGEDIESVWDVNSEIDELNGEFWQLIQTKQSEKDIRRQFKDLARESKDRGRFIADLERRVKRGEENLTSEDVYKAQAVYDQFNDGIKKGQKAYEDGDNQTAQDLLSELNDLRMQLDEFNNQINRGHEEEYFTLELEQLEKDIEEGEQEINKRLERGDINQEKADLCLGYVEEGRKYISQLREVQASGSMGEDQEIQARLENLGNKADRDCGDLFPEEGPGYNNYINSYIDEGNRDGAEKFFSKMDNASTKAMIKSLIENELSPYLNPLLERVSKFEQEIAKSMEALSFISSQYQEEVLSYKNTLLELVEQNKNLNETVQKRIASYNYYGSAAEELEQLLSKDGKVDEGKLNELETKARKEKFESGVIPFMDTDDNQWYTRFVVRLHNDGVVNGKTTVDGKKENYAPGDNVTIAEVLKMAFESGGLGKAAGAPGFGGNHWASGYFKQAENLGLTIMSNLKNADRPATRAEVVRIILEVAGIQPEFAESSFNDVGNHPDKSYIEEAKNLGIVSGDSGKGTFRPNDPVNRGEVAKIIYNFIDLKEAQEGVGGKGNEDESYDDYEEFKDETGDATGFFDSGFELEDEEKGAFAEDI